jgi:hypothetical protein
MIGNIAGKFHKKVSNNIGPAFDLIEVICDKNPKLILPINIVLLSFFPTWCIVGATVRHIRDNY